MSNALSLQIRFHDVIAEPDTEAQSSDRVWELSEQVRPNTADFWVLNMSPQTCKINTRDVTVERSECYVKLCKQSLLIQSLLFFNLNRVVRNQH